ncbi:MAG TPA: hypothetical protein VFC79_10070 [Tissierellaceae bacterium]|nr:hypothetical protein [Tissierellaceae bacterium]
MSKEEEARDEFFEYLLALDSVSRDSKFSPQIEPLESNFWSNLEKDIKEKESPVFLNSRETTSSKGKPSIHNRVEELGQKVQELEDYVHLVMRGPKGDKGADGVDGADFNLTEEDIKNAVKEGVIEGIKEFLSEKI